MKNAFYALLFISFLASCKSNTKPKVKDTIPTKSAANQTDALIEKFKPIVQGVWVEKDYIEKVVRTRSPLAAEDLIKGNTLFYINTDSIKGDSLIVPAGDNHEGTQFILKFQPGKTPSSLHISGGSELLYRVEKGVPILILSYFDTDKKKPVNIKFIKALDKQPEDNLGYGMDYLVNKGLVSGSYSLTDSAGIASKVTFSNDGKVFGFFNYSNYHINIDLNEGPMDNLDEITFNLYEKDYKSYAFKIIADTLNLYDSHPNADSTELILGKRIYKLVRQK